MKYRSLAELVAAYRTGELDEGNAVVHIDNDCVSVTEHDPGDVNWLHAETVFSTYPEDLLEQCLTLLQIPWEHV